MKSTKRTLVPSVFVPKRTLYIEPELIVPSVVLVGCVLSTCLKVVKPNQLGLVERFGKYTHTAKPGLRVIYPMGVGNMVVMPTDMQRVEIPGQSIITKEQLNAVVHAVVYYQVVDPYKAQYNVDNYKTTVPSLAQTTLRNILGTFTLAEANSQRKIINTRLKEELGEQISEWGMRVVSVELQQIEPDRRVQESMNDIVVAEQKMIAATNTANAYEIEADGKRRAAVKEAQGLAEALKLDADAKAEAVRMAANAEADAIKVRYQAVAENFTENVVEYQRLKTIEVSLQNNSKIVVPSGKNLTLLDVAKM